MPSLEAADGVSMAMKRPPTNTRVNQRLSRFLTSRQWSNSTIKRGVIQAKAVFFVCDTPL
jgi:hypothetical protein